MATEIMEKASEELRSSNTRLAQRAKIIEEAKTDVAGKDYRRSKDGCF
jgi:hypothetical protein